MVTELAEQLPDWSSTIDPSVHLDYSGLKAAAIKMASAPACMQRAVIEAYTNEYSILRHDPTKASGMLLLIRVLFVLPSADRKSFLVSSNWSHPVHKEKKSGKGWNYQWPVHANPHERVLEIERCQGVLDGRPGVHGAIGEYDYFKNQFHFPMRSPGEIEVLSIRGRP
jgi:hypothetical protein